MTDIESLRTKAIRAEASVLGCLLQGADLEDVLGAGIVAECFTNEAHRLIFETLVNLHDEGILNPRDATMQVWERLVAVGKEDVTGSGGPFALADSVLSKAAIIIHLPEFVEVVRRRSLYETAVRLQHATIDMSGLDAAESLVDSLLDGSGDIDTLPLAWGADAMDDIPPPEWLVDGMVEDGFGLILGRYGAGKSFFAADLAVAVASGQTWHGKPVAQRNVLYLAAEGKTGMAQRLRVCAESRGVGRDGLGIVSGVRLSEPSEVARLRGAIQKHDVGLLVIDTWNRVLGGIDENDTQAVGEAIAMLDRIRERFNCAVLIVHHLGKNGDDARGNTALPGAADSIVNVTKDPDSGVITLVNSKQKNADECADMQFRLRDAGESAVLDRLATTMDAPPSATQQRVAAFEFVRKMGRANRLAVEQRFGQSAVLDMLTHPDFTVITDDNGVEWLDAA